MTAYFNTLSNLGDETGGALLISTDGTDAATRVVKEVRAGRAGYLATNLRSEAGVTALRVAEVC